MDQIKREMLTLAANINREMLNQDTMSVVFIWAYGGTLSEGPPLGKFKCHKLNFMNFFTSVCMENKTHSGLQCSDSLWYSPSFLRVIVSFWRIITFTSEDSVVKPYFCMNILCLIFIFWEQIA